MIVGILPCVKITKLDRDVNSATSVHSDMLRPTVSQLKVEAKWWTKIGGLVVEIKSSGLRIPGYRAAEARSILRKRHDQIAPFASQKALGAP